MLDGSEPTLFTALPSSQAAATKQDDERLSQSQEEEEGTRHQVFIGFLFSGTKLAS